ncbi:hypothetical protein IPA_00795 [Ignicoccus pacificus DSM 13166]|uniref:Uncharacterized protein n=1 Tax=Ignicoccus pacificus DSM 13166 TaxID=940294 RepID=A0A977KAD8_9CREN|nr:hypothetical protein IPA_00795 [Ignicoccus pacificus DSM 13166]
MKKVLFFTLIFLIPILASQITVTVTPPYFIVPVNNTITMAVNVCCAPQTVDLLTVTLGDNPVTIVRTLDLIVPKGAYPINLIIKLSNNMVNYTTVAPLVVKATPPSVTITDYVHLEVGYLEGTIGINATLQVGNYTPNWNNYITITKTVTETYTMYIRETTTINNTIVSVVLSTIVTTMIRTVTRLIPETFTETLTMAFNITHIITQTWTQSCKLLISTTTVTTTVTKNWFKFSIPSVALLAPLIRGIWRKRKENGRQ